MQLCPKCNSSSIQKRGFTNGKQRHCCKDCSNWFSVSLTSNAETPKGYIIKGQSTLYDEDGNVKLTWEKVDRNQTEQFEIHTTGQLRASHQSHGYRYQVSTAKR